MRSLITILLMAVACLTGMSTADAAPPEVSDSVVLGRIFAYDRQLRQQLEGQRMNVYSRFRLHTEKKNITLLAVPTMYRIARGKHADYAGETYSRVTFTDVTHYESLRQVSVGTTPHYKELMPALNKFRTPDLYYVTLMNDHLLSPFHIRNRQIYRYGFRRVAEGLTEVVFHPRTHNTQMVSGKAFVNTQTGQILGVDLEGEYDMVTFRVHADLGKEGAASLLPKTCDVQTQFHFMGNRITMDYSMVFDLPETLPDSLIDSHDRALMERLRPTPLPADIERIYQQHDSIALSASPSTKKVKRRNPLKTILWDVIGDNLVNRIKGNFGSNDQGSFRISPILNPLYLGYTGRKGLTYKFKLRGNYHFSEEQELSAQFRGGYSFKQKQFYFRLPLTYTFCQSHNGFVSIEVGNGNRITNASVKKSVIDEHHEDSARIEKMNLDYFRDTYVKLRSNYDLDQHWGVGAGLTFHRRAAVDKRGFDRAGRPDTYHTFAPMAEVSFRPDGWRGPIFILNYEQAIKGIGNANMNYGRLEGEMLWLRRFNRLRSLSMRWGGGVYTMKDRDNYFLDFENFRDDNMPGGWNDDWTGEFQLLSSETYNSSDYYLRGNITYESPLMVLSRTPFLGKYVEMERIYASALLVDGIHPYTECGYGFTNRLFSIGVFVATRNGSYDGIGCRLGLELFRDW